MSGCSSSPPFALFLFFNESEGEAGSLILLLDAVQGWQGLKKNVWFVYTVLHGKENMSAQCLSIQGLFFQAGWVARGKTHVILIQGTIVICDSK